MIFSNKIALLIVLVFNLFLIAPKTYGQHKVSLPEYSIALYPYEKWKVRINRCYKRIPENRRLPVAMMNIRDRIDPITDTKIEKHIELSFRSDFFNNAKGLLPLSSMKSFMLEECCGSPIVNKDHSTYQLIGIDGTKKNRGTYFIDTEFVDTELYYFRVRGNGIDKPVWQLATFDLKESDYNIALDDIITLFSADSTKRNSHLPKSSASAPRKMSVGTIYNANKKSIHLSVNWAMLKRPLSIEARDWKSISLNTLTFNDLRYAWGEAIQNESFSTFILKGVSPKGYNSGIYTLDVKFLDSKVDEYRIRHFDTIYSDWIKAKDIKKPRIIGVDTKIYGYRQPIPPENSIALYPRAEVKAKISSCFEHVSKDKKFPVAIMDIRKKFNPITGVEIRNKVELGFKGYIFKLNGFLPLNSITPNQLKVLCGEPTLNKDFSTYQLVGIDGNKKYRGSYFIDAKFVNAKLASFRVRGNGIVQQPKWETTSDF